jgi:hypothetical protein
VNDNVRSLFFGKINWILYITDLSRREDYNKNQDFYENQPSNNRYGIDFVQFWTSADETFLNGVTFYSNGDANSNPLNPNRKNPFSYVSQYPEWVWWKVLVFRLFELDILVWHALLVIIFLILVPSITILVVFIRKRKNNKRG